MTSHTRKHEAFILVLVPDRDFRERHHGTSATARQRAAEWLREFNASATAAEQGQQDAAEIYRIADFARSTTYGEIIASRAACDARVRRHP